MTIVERPSLGAHAPKLAPAGIVDNAWQEGYRQGLVEASKEAHAELLSRPALGAVTAAQGTTEPLKPDLQFVTAAQLAAEIDQSPPVGFLCSPIWPADAYGVIAAPAKAGKTWGDIDLGVSVASNTQWMGLYPVERPGRVVMFLGEGGRRKMLRRFRAVCAAKSLRFEDLPIDLCFRVPGLTNPMHLGEISDYLTSHTDIVLVIVDPLYLAAKGAKGSSLYDMATVLEPLQMLTQQAGCALAVIHHFNQTGKGSGAERMSGAGPMEWGRVLVSVDVKAKHKDKDTKATAVTLAWHFEGDEIPDTDLRIRRRVWADNPDDLNSPLNYEIDHLDDEPAAGDLSAEKPAVRRVADILDTHPAAAMTVADLGDILANDDTGIPLKARTIQDALKRLGDLGRASIGGCAGRSGPTWQTTSPAHAHISFQEEENAF